MDVIIRLSCLQGGGHKPLIELSTAHTHPYLPDTHPASGVTTTKISNWDAAYTHSQTPHNYAAASHTHTKSLITDFPTSLPASDVYDWAKAATKPSYTYSEVGAAAASHKHNYASSSSAGGPADYVRWEYGGSNVNRRIPFAWGDNVETTDTRVRLVYSDLFQYNPSTNVLTVGSITGSAGSVAWANVTGKPTSFTPADHTHNFNEIGDGANVFLNAGTVVRRVFLTRTKNSNGYISRACLGLTNPISLFSPVILSVGTNDAGTTFRDFTFHPNGNLNIDGSYYANSDIRYKDIQSYLSTSVEDISKLSIFNYKWTDDKHDNEVHTGMSAQDVELILPNLVTEDETGFKSLNYATFGAISSVINARYIMKHENEINRLNKIINELKEEIEYLKQK